MVNGPECLLVLKCSYELSNVMAHVLKGLNWKHGLWYIDDILIFSSSFQEHLQHLESVFYKLRQAGLTLKADKCHFAVDRGLYLGHVITKNGIFL